MNKQIQPTLLCTILFLSFFISFPQSKKDDNKKDEFSPLFITDETLPIAISYSNKDIKKETNDSTFIETHLRYMNADKSWDSLEVRLRKRGNNRLKNCYFAPIKIKISKNAYKGTLFDSHKNLKLYLPCLLQKDKDDNMIKEYLAYKLYEIVSPYHFKARLVTVNYQEIKGKKVKEHQMIGFLLEDDKHVAKRVGGKVYDRKVHRLNQDNLESIRNSFFQYMIGNTDYSNYYQHNSKIIYQDKKFIPIPYDFDMSGLVNTSYSVVSQINNQQLSIESVTERLYRGLERAPEVYDQVRSEFIANRANIIAAIEKCAPLFEDEREYKAAKDFINEFYTVIIDDKKYESKILKVARSTKD